MNKSSVDVWLWLLLVMQPHNRRLNFILRDCGYDAVKAAAYIRDSDPQILTDVEKRRVLEVRMGEIRKLIQLCEDNDVNIVSYDDGEYPELLRHIEDPPTVLFAAGDLKGLNERLCISAVGTRSASEYGYKVTKEICGSLAERGAVVVSGMAVGLDGAAHRAALDAGGKTVGVLGCGILVNYPAPNAQLKRDIVNNGGAIISELLPNTKGLPGYFHARNRILAGISHGTLVLEAGEKSGSLITAAHAEAQGRDIFCIPPYDILSDKCSGVVPLLRDGAVAVYGYSDILNAFPLLGAPVFSEKPSNEKEAQKVTRPPKKAAPQKADAPKQSEGTAEKPADKSAENKAPFAPRLEGLSAIEAEIIKLLFERPMDEDGIIDKTGRDFAEISELLTSLEINGLIVRNMDGTYEPRLDG